MEQPFILEEVRLCILASWSFRFRLGRKFNGDLKMVNCLECGKKLEPGERCFEVTVGAILSDEKLGDYFDPYETTYHVCENCQEDKIGLAIQEIEEYVPEFVLEDPRKTGDGQVLDKLEIYHPKSSVDSFRENLINILKYGKLGVEIVEFK